MGILAQRWQAAADSRSNVRSAAADFLKDDYEPAAITSPAGVSVTRHAALGLTTVWRCVDLITHAVSLAPVDLFVKIGARSFPEYATPPWLAMPNPADPNYTSGDYFGEAVLSMLLDGNYFSYVTPDVYNPQAVTVLDPRRVVVRPGPLYDIEDEMGRVIATLTPAQVLHGWWLRLPGTLRGISPLEALKRGIGSAIAAEDFAARFFAEGAALSFGVEVPYAMDQNKLNTLRDSLKAKYAGNRNSHAIGVLADGGKFVSGLAPTPEQAQMLATRKFSVEDLCRPYGVPPGMAGSQEPGASSYASALVWREQFRDDAVLKFTQKIERTHTRLLTVPDSIHDPNATAHMRLNLDWIARTDLLARYQAHGEGVRGGFITPNEARAYEDKAPLEGGDTLYMLQQMVPLADLGKTKATEPLDTQPKPAGVAQ